MWYLHSTLTYCVVVNTMRSVFLGIFGIIFSMYFESIVEFSVLVSSGLLTAVTNKSNFPSSWKKSKPKPGSWII